MKRIFLLGSVLLTAMTSLAADVQTSENQVTIRPDGGQAKVIRLEVRCPAAEACLVDDRAADDASQRLLQHHGE